MINLSTNFKIPKYKYLNLTLNTKWSDKARDYGNGNRTFNDERLNEYLINDLSLNYKLFNTLDMFFVINNLTNEKYETAKDYSQIERSFNFGVRKAY